MHYIDRLIEKISELISEMRAEREDRSELRKLTRELKAHADPLRKAVAANQISGTTPGVVNQTKEGRNMAAIDDLTAQITANEDVEDSALALINGFAARLAAAGVDPVKLKQLQDDLKAHADALAAAVAANTPAAPKA